jgi:hypothetical protein
MNDIDRQYAEFMRERIEARYRVTFDRAYNGMRGADGCIYRARYRDDGYGDKVAIQKKVPGVRGWKIVSYNRPGCMAENLAEFLEKVQAAAPG